LGAQNKTMDKKIEAIIKTAENLIGVPYKYGAKKEDAPDFFDCSLFIQYLFEQIGIDLPRSTIEQAREGTEVRLENIQPGDLIFMHGSRGHYNKYFPQGIGHIGLYVGNNQVIHAASTRIKEKPIIEKGSVVKSSLEEFLEGWKPLVTIKRIIG